MKNAYYHIDSRSWLEHWTIEEENEMTGLEIFRIIEDDLRKHGKLDKMNCGECGYPTCLAFAMAIAHGEVKFGDCLER